ncbi:hypothetical protein RRG08_056913 [Elysia crispata]|uniref:Uncharacterized protein n=1 Tax=Elysia crispata TaxID=231223 RepID=A0AAE1CQY2_9GAST|nr:hypothetical protein RRG08_056913 [Elysia crispata]
MATMIPVRNNTRLFRRSPDKNIYAVLMFAVPKQPGLNEMCGCARDERKAGGEEIRLAEASSPFLADTLRLPLSRPD